MSCVPVGRADLRIWEKIKKSESRKREKEAFSLGASAGRISGEYLYPYPPGIKLLCPGERISEHLLKRIQSLREEGFELEGLEDHQLERIFVVK